MMNDMYLMIFNLIFHLPADLTACENITTPLPFLPSPAGRWLAKVQG